MRVRRTLAAVSLAALLAATASCSTDDPPDPDGSPRASESPSATTTSPSPTETDPPQRESAKAFIRRWQSAADEMQRSGHSDEFLRISGDCAGCRDFAQTITGIYEAGGWIRFAGTHVGRITRSGTIEGDPHWDAAVRVSTTRVKDDAAAEVRRIDPTDLTMRVVLNQQGDTWHVVDYGTVD